jgi:hypothetical protein
MSTNALKMFKSYNQRVAKNVKAALEAGTLTEAQAPESQFTVVDIKGTKTCHAVNEKIQAVAGETLAALESLISSVKDFGVENRVDVSYLSEIPKMETIRKHLLEALKIEDILRTAIRNAATEEYYSAYPEAEAVAFPPKAQGETSSRGGPSLKLDF